MSPHTLVFSIAIVPLAMANPQRHFDSQKYQEHLKNYVPLTRRPNTVELNPNRDFRVVDYVERWPIRYAT